MFDKKILDEWKKLNKILIGTSKGGRDGQSINFYSDDKAYSGKCFGDVAPGKCFALKTEDGQLYLYANVDAPRNIQSRFQRQYKKTKKITRPQLNKNLLIVFSTNQHIFNPHPFSGRFASNNPVEIIEDNDYYFKAITKYAILGAPKHLFSWYKYVDVLQSPSLPRVEGATSIPFLGFEERAELEFGRGHNSYNLLGNELEVATEFFGIGQIIDWQNSANQVSYHRVVVSFICDEIIFLIVNDRISKPIDAATIVSEAIAVPKETTVYPYYKYLNFEIILSIRQFKSSITEEESYIVIWFSPDITLGGLRGFVDLEDLQIPQVRAAINREGEGFYKYIRILKINNQTLDILTNDLYSYTNPPVVEGIQLSAKRGDVTNFPVGSPDIQPYRPNTLSYWEDNIYYSIEGDLTAAFSVFYNNFKQAIINGESRCNVKLIEYEMSQGYTPLTYVNEFEKTFSLEHLFFWFNENNKPIFSPRSFLVVNDSFD